MLAVSGIMAARSVTGLRKIEDVVCLSLKHHPDIHPGLEPGKYEYTCPDCGTMIRFVIGPEGRFLYSI